MTTKNIMRDILDIFCKGYVEDIKNIILSYESALNKYRVIEIYLLIITYIYWKNRGTLSLCCNSFICSKD